MKMHYFSNKFSKIAKHLIFNLGDLKLRGLAKLWIFKLIMTKLNFKKTVMTSFQSHHGYYVTEKRHYTNVTRFFYFVHLAKNFRLRQCKDNILCTIYYVIIDKNKRIYCSAAIRASDLHQISIVKF